MADLLHAQVYRRELEEDNVVVDPLRASYMVPGVTAREVVQHFFDKDTRLSWDGMLESVDVVETLAEDTIIFHQLHKRVWPSTQRETLYCSHMCTLTNAPVQENMVGHTWMVCNFSMDHDKIPVRLNLIIVIITYLFCYIEYKQVDSCYSLCWAGLPDGSDPPNSTWKGV